MVNAFEHEFAQKVGIGHALAVSSGTAAMDLAIASSGDWGDEVIADGVPAKVIKKIHDQNS